MLHESWLAIIERVHREDLPLLRAGNLQRGRPKTYLRKKRA